MKKQKCTFSVPKTESIINGIRFYSKRYKGYYALSTIDKDGNIKAEWTNAKEEKQKLRFGMWMLIVLFLWSWIIAIIFITIDIVLQNFIYGIRFLVGAIFVLELVMFLFVSYLDRRMGIAKFHYAEHLAINAYKDLKRLPRPGELLKYSHFTSNCPINYVTFTLCTFGMIYADTFFIGNVLALMIVEILYIFFVILLVNGYFNFLQVFPTKRCSTKELHVAIAGLKVWIENEYQEVSVE